MSSTPLPATVGQRRPLGVTPVGVDVGVKNLIAAAPADGDVESAFTIEGSHIRTRHEALVEAMRALQGAKFDSTEGQIQLFAALWHQIRPQVYDAAVRVVRYAQEFSGPMLVLEDLSFCDATLWERRTASDIRIVKILYQLFREAVWTEVAEEIGQWNLVEGRGKCGFQFRQIFDKPILEPVFQLIPTPFDWVQLGQMRREIPDLENFVLDAFDRGVIDTLNRTLPADELPEILRVEIRGLVQKDHELLAKFGAKRP